MAIAVFTSFIAMLNMIHGLVRVAYQSWKGNPRPGVFRFPARFASIADGKRGGVGLSLTWRDSVLEG